MEATQGGSDELENTMSRETLARIAVGALLVGSLAACSGGDNTGPALNPAQASHSITVTEDDGVQRTFKNDIAGCAEVAVGVGFGRAFIDMMDAADKVEFERIDTWFKTYCNGE